MPLEIEKAEWSHEIVYVSTNMKDQERDILRKTILELVKKGHAHYTDIKKSGCNMPTLRTSNTVRK